MRGQIRLRHILWPAQRPQRTTNALQLTLSKRTVRSSSFKVNAPRLPISCLFNSVHRNGAMKKAAFILVLCCVFWGYSFPVLQMAMQALSKLYWQGRPADPAGTLG